MDWWHVFWDEVNILFSPLCILSYTIIVCLNPPALSKSSLCPCEHQTAANDEAKRTLVFHNVILGCKSISDVPLELLIIVKKELEKRMEEAAKSINHNLILC